jgi:outer membrane protein TolC
MAKNQVAIAKDNLHITRSDLFPVVSLMARYNISNVQAQAGFVSLNQTSGMIYGLSARWNIFNGLATRRNIQNAKTEVNIAQISADAVNFNLNAQLNAAFEDYTVALESLSLEKKNLGIAVQNLDIATERYKIGRTGVLEYRQAQVGYTEAHNRLIQAVYNAKIAEITLLRLSGQMENIKE